MLLAFSVITKLPFVGQDLSLIAGFKSQGDILIITLEFIEKQETYFCSRQ